MLLRAVVVDLQHRHVEEMIQEIVTGTETEKETGNETVIDTTIGPTVVTDTDHEVQKVVRRTAKTATEMETSHAGRDTALELQKTRTESFENDLVKVNERTVLSMEMIVRKRVSRVM